MADPASHPEGLRRCSLIRKWLAVPGLDAAGLDGSERMVMHAGVLQHKKLLRDVFGQFHDTFVQLDNRYFSKTEGITVELGAGVAPVRDSYPHVLATDIVADPRLDMTLDAQSMALSDGSVHAIYGQNCFHHFPNPARFFGEAVRVLQPGGGIILIEPYYGAVASWVYPRLFAEGFDKKAPSWQTVQSGPMVGANQALTYLVFVRDRAKFLRKFPQLKIVHEKPLTNYVRYLLSGGLNFRALVPDWTSGVIRLCEILQRQQLRCWRCTM
jgi:SAM-dependent methyltransferase